MSAAITTALESEESDRQAMNPIRFRAVDAVENADSGHPGLPMRAAPMAYVWWTLFLRHNPVNRRDVGDRDNIIGVDRFGALAPGPVVMREYGFSVENVCERAMAWRKRKYA